MGAKKASRAPRGELVSNPIEWREPTLMWLELRGDLLPRLLLGLASCVFCMSLALLLAATNQEFVKSLVPLAAMGAFLGIGGGALIFFYPERKQGKITLKEGEIGRYRMQASVTGYQFVWENWSYADIYQALLIPGQSLGTRFSVLVLSFSGGVQVLGVPGTVDLRRLGNQLAARGVSVSAGHALPPAVRSTHSFSRPFVVGAFGLAGLTAVVAPIAAVVWQSGRQDGRPAPAQAEIPRRPAVSHAPPPPPAPQRLPRRAAPTVSRPRRPPETPTSETPPKGLVRQFAGHEGAIAALAISPDGRRVLSCGRGVFIWADSQDAPTGRYTLHRSALKAVAFSPDGARAISADASEVHVWEVATRRQIATFDSYGPLGNAVAFSADGKNAIFAGRRSTVIICDIRTGDELAQLQGLELPLIAAIDSADGRFVFATDGQQVLRWDLESGKRASLNRVKKFGLYTKAALPEQGMAVFGDATETVVWDMVKGEKSREITIPGGLGCAVVTTDGQKAFLGVDKEVAVWDFRNNVEVTRIPAHTLPVTHIATTPDGSRIASASSWNGTVCLWEPQLPTAR